MKYNWVVLASMTLTLVGCGNRDIEPPQQKPAPVRANPEKQEPLVEDLTNVVPAFSLTAEEFFLEFENDQNAAEAKYQGKVIELTGVVDLMSNLEALGGMIHLSAGKKPAQGMWCATAHPEPWSKVVPGQIVKLKGRSNRSADLFDCVLLETGPYQAISISAKMLAGEYGTKPDAARKKYDRKYMKLTGEIMDKRFDSVGNGTIVLKGDGKVQVVCLFGIHQKNLVRPLKIGEQIIVVGEFFAMHGEDQVTLQFCLPIKRVNP